MEISKRNHIKAIAKVLCLLLLVQFFCLDSLTAFASTNANITFSTTGTLNVGANIEISVNLNNSQNLYGGSVDFIYDSSLIEITGIEKGSLFNNSNVQTPVSTYGNGKASIAMTLTGSSPNISGNGTLAVIKAKVLKPGTLNFKATESNDSLSLTGSTCRVKLSNNNGEREGYTSTDSSITLNSSVSLEVLSIDVDKAAPQPANTTIRATSKANGNGNLTYKFWIYDGAGWTVTQDFSSKDYFDWTPTKTGTHRIWVDVKDSTGTMVSKELYYDVSAPLAINTVGTDKLSPQIEGSTIKVTPTVAGGAGEYSYKFWVYDGSAWTVTQDFSTNSSYDWIPSKSGDYKVWVDVKDGTGKMVSKEIPYKVTGKPLGISSIDVDKVAPQPANTTIRATAKITGGTGNLTYKFWIYDGAGWTVTQDFSSKDYFDWTPTKTETHRIWVDVKDATGTMISKELYYNISAPLVINKIGTDKASPQIEGSTIKVTPTVAGGAGEYSYKFWIYDGSAWTVTQDFSAKSTYDWIPSKSGDYKVWVDVKDGTGKMVSKEIPYKVTGKPLEISSIDVDKVAPQPANTTIRATAKAKNGTGNLTYKFWIYDGAGWTVTQDFSSKDYFDWTPTKKETHRIWVDVKDATGTMISKELYYDVSAPLAINKIGTDKASPQIEGSTIKVTPTVAGGAGEYSYKFWIYDGSAWTVTQDFSAKSTYDWIPSKSGDYKVWVDVKDGTGKMVSKEIPYKVTGKPLEISSIDVDKVAPQPANTTIRATAKAKNGTGNLTYKFWIYDGAGWTVTQDFSSKDYFDWTPTKKETHRIWVDVKDATGTMISKELYYDVSAPLAINKIGTDKASPQIEGSTIKVTPTVAGGAGEYSYKFWVYDGSAWTVTQDFSAKSSYDWNPLKAGDYKIWVDVKDGTGKMVSKEIPYKIIVKPLEISSIDVDKVAPQPANTTIRATAKAKNGTGNLTYKFWIYDGAGWTVTQDFSSKDYFDWTPIKSGTHRIWVDVKDATGTMISKELYYDVSAPLAINTVGTDKASPQIEGSTIKVTPTVAGGAGEYSYKFWIYDGSAWTVTQDFSAKSSYDWVPSKSGDYKVWVDVKDGTGKMVSKEIPYKITGKPLEISSIDVDKVAPQPANTTIRATAKAKNGTGNLTYKFWIYDGAGWTVTQDFSSKDYFDWTPIKSGTHRIWVDVKDATGTMISKELYYDVSAPLAINTVGTDKASPQIEGSTIKVTPTVAGGAGEYSYKFWIYDGSAWTVTQDFSAKSSYDWVPSKSGDYKVWVDVKDGTGKMVSKEIPYKITGKPVEISSIDVDKVAPQPANTTIRATAKAKNGTGNLTYKFWIYDGAGWTVTQDFSSKDYFDWTPIKSGTHRIWVDVKDATGTMISKELYYDVLGELVINSLSSDKPSPQLTSTTVKFTTNVAGGFGPYNYKYWVYDGSGWTVTQDFGDKNYYNWTPAKPGVYRIWVDVKDNSGKMISKEIYYTAEGQVTMSGNVNSVDGVNVRSGPGTNYSRIGSLGYRNSVEIVDSSDSSWHKIKFNGGYGYVHKDYISFFKSLDYYVDIQIKKGNMTDKNGSWENATRDDVKYYMDYNNFTSNDSRFMFMKLNYNSSIPVSAIENVISGRGILSGKGNAFSEGARKYNVNPIYLACHARLETGNGKSQLASGVLVRTVEGRPVEPRIVYNMYGIGAFDSDPLRLGTERAYKEGWFTPELAISEGAKWVGSNYINNTSFYQDTLYEMRWNLSSDSVGWHQYASDIGWAYKQAIMMATYLRDYKNYLEFELPKFD